MPLTPPNLDQRTFESLVAEVRQRIPTLTPEWTDLNDSDPGMTLAQLFAFMSEQLLFQINQVPEKGLITFLKMVGVELHAATPALADVTLLPQGGTATTFDLSAATQVATSGPPPGEKTPVTFETSEPFTVLNGTIAELLSQDCTLAFRSNQNANEGGKQTFAPFGDATSTVDALFIAFNLTPTVGPPPWPEGRFRLRINLAGSVDVGEPPPPELQSDAPPRLTWAYANGDTGNADGTRALTFAPLTPAVDSTLEFTQSGYVELEFDATTAAQFFRAGPLTEPEEFRNRFVVRVALARPDAFADLLAPELATIRLNTVPATAVQTVRDEVLGGSTGLAFQRFRLANAPVVVGSSVVLVNEATQGAGTTEWHEAEDLFAAGPLERVYQLLPATGEILFGNGTFGKIPAPDDGSLEAGNIKMDRYQFGGGLRGNVGSQTLTNVTLVDTGLPAFNATNVLGARGGAEEEPIAQGLARAPAVVRSRFRAVTARDFEALAMETPQVRVDRAFALPNSRPGLTPGNSPGSVTVILVPHAEFEKSIQSEIPLEPFVAASVLRFLDARRLVTTEVFVEGARFRKITVDATLELDPRVSATETRSAAIDALNHFFHALVGGLDGLGWSFGGTVYFSRVFERLLEVPGVSRTVDVRMSLDDGPLVSCQDLPIGFGQLLVSGQHVVRTRFAT